MNSEQTARLSQGIALHKLGTFSQAASIYRDVLAVSPKNADALHLLGLALAALGELEPGIQAIQQAISIVPTIPFYYRNLGKLYRDDKRFDDAIAIYQQGLVAAGPDPETYCSMASTWKAIDKLDEAEQTVRKAIAIAPDMELAWTNLGVYLTELKRNPEAIASFERALQINPNAIAPKTNLAVLYAKTKSPKQAESLYREILTIDPSNAIAIGNLANLLVTQARVAEAIALCEQALLANPTGLAQRANLAVAYYNALQLDAAEKLLREVLAESPENADYRSQLGMILLTAGKYAEGWGLYEARHEKTPEPFLADKRHLEWTGQDLQGKTILLLNEQGMGDAIHFIRFSNTLKARFPGCRVWYAGQPSLFPLLTYVSGVDRLSKVVSSQEPVDYWCHLLSIPNVLGYKTEADFPCDIPYLYPDSSRCEFWRAKIESLRAIEPEEALVSLNQVPSTSLELTEPEALRVGIFWQGNPDYAHDSLRSFALKQAACLFELPDVQWFSLQSGYGREQLTDFEHRDRMIDWTDQMDPKGAAFVDTAALLSSMDLVIACDSSVAHLAGALGIPVWLALSHLSDWRWTAQGTQSAWYPNHRLFRQSTIGDWADVFHSMFQALKSAQPRNQQLLKAKEQDAHRLIQDAGENIIANELDLAEKQLYQSLAVRCDLASAWQNLGVVLLKRNLLVDAESSFQRAIELEPDNSDGWSNLAKIHLAQNKLDSAVTSFQNSLRIRATSGEEAKGIADLQMLADIYRKREQTKERIEVLERILSLKPDDAASSISLAQLYRTHRRFAESATTLELLLSKQPNHLIGLINLSAVYSDLHLYDAALTAAEKAKAIDSESIDIRVNLAQALRGLRRLQECKQECEWILARAPESTNAMCILGLAFREAGQHEKAAEYFERAYRITPDDEQIAILHAVGLRYFGRLDEAQSIYETCLTRNPRSAKAHNNLGNVEKARDRLESAAKHYRKAIELEPDSDDGRLGLGIVHLTRGEFREGWRLYRNREQPKHLAFKMPPWTDTNAGSPAGARRWVGEDLSGKSLLIVAEQGLGDTIMFIRYAAEIKRRWQCQLGLLLKSSLRPLLTQIQSIDAWHDGDQMPAGYNYCALLMDLPECLGHFQVTDFPRANRYLHADSSRLEKWTSRMQSIAKPRIGLAWQGSKSYISDRSRSIPFHLIQALLEVKGAEWICLHNSPDQVKEAKGQMVVFEDMDIDGQTFMDSAAIIEQLDLVISCDTSIAHLAAAMGKPVWLALSRPHDWRWLESSLQNPWYPAIEIFRQEEVDDWSNVLQGIVRRLPEFLAELADPISVSAERRPTPDSSPRTPIVCGDMNELVKARHGWMLYNKHDRYIGKSISMMGEFSEEEVITFRQLIRPGWHVVEAGSNIGTHTIPLARLVGPTGVVYAFEAQRVIFQILCANLALNGIANVRAFWTAVGAEEGSIQVPILDYTKQNNFGGLSLDQKRVGEQVDLVTIDSLQLTKLHMIKADVEGMEMDVLVGAKDTIERFRPIFYLENDRAEKKEALIDYLRGLDYRMFAHMPLMYSKSNFFGCIQNPFGSIRSHNVLAIHKSCDCNITGSREIK